MADMPTDFWAGWIVVITGVSLLGLAWLIFSIYFSANKYEETKSPVWDETLSEGSHPAPMWWFWMILIALVLSVVYLMLYPGLGSFSGVLKWSQGGRLDQSLIQYGEKFAPLRQEILQRSITELQNDPAIMKSAERIFAQNCAACHGPSGEGQAYAFPNLKDNDWQWGGSEAAIEHTLKNGRRAVMVGWKNILGEQGVSQVINYIKTLSPGETSTDVSQGKKLYQQNCVACHGMAGEGNAALGAPNLSDEIWLYGNSDAALQHTISAGRNGIMPAFGERLNETQVRMLVAWLMPKDDSVVVVTPDTQENVVTDQSTEDGNSASDVQISGEQIYAQYCVVCHQSNGEGLPAVFPPLKNNAVVLAEDASEHIDIVLNGLKDKVIDGVSYLSPMSGFGEQLNDKEVAAVVNHERTQWGNSAKLITIDDVAVRR